MFLLPLGNIEAGVLVEFSAHSTAKVVDVSKILAKAGWSSSNVFHKFYNKPVHYLMARMLGTMYINVCKTSWELYSS